MANPVTFAASLYAKLHGANATIKTRVKRVLQEAMDSGAFPLGVCDDGGKPAYLWLVHDPSRFASPEDMRQRLQDRSPPDLPLVILTI